MNMKSIIIAAAVVIGLPTLVTAQGIVGGAAQGAESGSHAAGPVGGVVGGAVGAVEGGVAGLLGIDQRPRFREYVVHENRTSYRYDRPVMVGAVLPESGVTYYEVPSEYGIRTFRYTIVNDRTVLVDPSTHRIMQVIE
jgi:hypothetical protein